MIAPNSTPLVPFPLGRVVATPGAVTAFDSARQGSLEFLYRHQHGDWGLVGQADAMANQDALAHGGWILSAYRLKDRTKIWIITDADRSTTTIILPEEY